MNKVPISIYLFEIQKQTFFPPLSLLPAPSSPGLWWVVRADGPGPAVLVVLPAATAAPESHRDPSGPALQPHHPPRGPGAAPRAPAAAAPGFWDQQCLQPLLSESGRPRHRQPDATRCSPPPHKLTLLPCCPYPRQVNTPALLPISKTS